MENNQNKTKFPVEKILSLAFLGKGWENAELVFSGLTFAQTRELASNVDISDTVSKDKNEKNFDIVVKFLTDHFIRGKAWNGTTTVDITKDDIVDLPVEVINKAVLLLSGQPDPKS
jgi:ribosomal protein L13E